MPVKDPNYNPWWARVVFDEYCAHYYGMTREEMAEDVIQSIKDVLAKNPNGNSFGAKMVELALNRIKTNRSARAAGGSLGGRPSSSIPLPKNIGDAPTREDGENTDNGGTTTASANLESGTSPTNMPRVGQNEAHPRIQGGERPAQGSMSLSPEEAAQSGNLYNGSAKTHQCGRGDRATTHATSPSAQTSGKPISISTNDQVTAHPRGYTGASRGASTAKNSTKSSRKSRIPGNFDTVIDWCVEHGQDIDDARQIWDMTLERGGHDADGNKIENWWGYLVQCLKTKKENRK